MLPAQLTSAAFKQYPDKGREFAISHLQVFSSLPLALLASILREAIQFDWLFPAEQRHLESQCAILQSLPAEKKAAAIAGFTALNIPSQLSDLDWVNKPARFTEELTAYLWSSSQIDAFRAAAIQFASATERQQSNQEKAARLCVVMLPADLDKPGYPLFRKLRPHGTFFQNIAPGWHEDEILNWIKSQTGTDSARLSHFYVDGGTTLALQPPFEQIGWNQSAALRNTLLDRLHRMTQTPGIGPEMARSQLSGLSPGELGIGSSGEQAVLDRFLLRVLAEGSGTQIFSTTFVQWTARELLRRAEPLSLVVRFGARDEFRPMDVMLSGSTRKAALDPAGSFVDADMGAYYTWVNLQRLRAAESARFLAISQARGQAVAIGPGLPRGTFSSDRTTLAKIFETLA